ncbi:hypothetical protein [Streptomyces sp. NPDC059533]|uniref:hypothetical protein n=1 Tax=unclassified Streptomyces TaxID=2593676 RepID=UPI0036CE02B1
MTRLVGRAGAQQPVCTGAQASWKATSTAHLTAMRGAGLLTAHRPGKEVLCARTTPAHALIDRT